MMKAAVALGIGTLKQFHRLSHDRDRPWQAAFGTGIRELEAAWLGALRATEGAREELVSTLESLLARDPGAACLGAQALAAGTR